MWIMMSHVLKIKKSIFVYWEIVSVFLYQFSWFSWIHVHVWPVNEMQYNCPPPLLQSHAHQSPPVLYRQPFHCSISGLISSLCQQHLEKLARIGFQKNFVYLIKQILCNFYQTGEQGQWFMRNRASGLCGEQGQWFMWGIGLVVYGEQDQWFMWGIGLVVYVGNRTSGLWGIGLVVYGEQDQWIIGNRASGLCGE